MISLLKKIDSRVVALLVGLATLSGCRIESPLPHSEEDDGQRVGQEDVGASSGSADMSLAGGQTPAQPPQPVTITDIKTSGDACPAGTVATSISADKQAFGVLFSKYVLAIEGGPKMKKVTGRCLVEASVNLPKGWQVSVISLDRRGYASLPKGSVAILTTQVNFADKAKGKVIRTKLAGPYDNDFVSSGVIPLTKLSWSPCGGPAVLEIDEQATIRAQKGVSVYFAQDSLDGELRQNLGLTWRACK